MYYIRKEGFSQNNPENRPLAASIPWLQRTKQQQKSVTFAQKKKT